MKAKTTFVLLSLFFPVLLFAHGSHGSGIMAGFTHPILGIDHAITILASGFLAYLINNSKWVLIFSAFLVAMIIGGYFGINQEATLLIEKIIAASVLLIGLFILFHKNLNILIVSFSFAMFGFFHGFAHGAEMPVDLSSWVYISGFSLGTILMGSVGMFVARIANSKSDSERRNSLMAGIVIGCGIIILLA